jgi:DNA mismatch endonuclease (patch repair protein)
MTDRSAIMRAVKSRDTKPEKIIRKLAWSIRPGYRLHRKGLPGKPDLVYGRGRKAIFVHGCFWHGHDCARGARVPKENRSYWVAKVARNVKRDRNAINALKEAGWQSLVIWECELKSIDDIKARLSIFLV